MSGQFGTAFRGFVDRFRDRHELRPVGDGVGQNPDGTGDDGQNVVEIMSHAAGQLADRLHLLGLAELGFRDALFRNVAADKEVPPDGLRPRSHPRQRHGLSVLVDVARFETADALPAPRRPHLVARAVEIVGMDEFNRAAPDHFRGGITQDGHAARADRDENSSAIRHQNEVL
jgi:hypothetical protein